MKSNTKASSNFLSKGREKAGKRQGKGKGANAFEKEYKISFYI